MEQKERIKTIVGTLIVVAILGTIGSSIYNGGWSQGFMIGSLTSGAEGSALMAPHAMTHHAGSFLFGIIGAIFKIAFFFFFFMMIAKLFCFAAWRMMRKHGGFNGGFDSGGDWSHFAAEGPRGSWMHFHKQYGRGWGCDEANEANPKKETSLKNNGAYIDV